MNKSIFKTPRSERAYYKPKSTFYMPKAVAKISYEPTFNGFTPLQKAMAMDELNHALAMVKAKMMVKGI